MRSTWPSRERRSSGSTSQPVDARRRGSPAATRSTAAPPTPTARSSYNTLDGQTVAVDAATGKEVWRAQLGDINQGESMTMAPLVVKGKVLVGNSGGEFGVRGWLTALDAGDRQDRLEGLHAPARTRTC